jgi:hypothetical protein
MREDVLNAWRTRLVGPNLPVPPAQGPGAALVAHGYVLTEEEFATVLDLRRRTAALGDGMVAALLANGLRNRAGSPPGRPGSPGRPARGRRGRDARAGTAPGAVSPPAGGAGPGDRAGVDSAAAGSPKVPAGSTVATA